MSKGDPWGEHLTFGMERPMWQHTRARAVRRSFDRASDVIARSGQGSPAADAAMALAELELQQFNHSVDAHGEIGMTELLEGMAQASPLVGCQECRRLEAAIELAKTVSILASHAEP